MKKRIIIIGAGDAGLMIAREFKTTEHLKQKYILVGFFDDDKAKKDVAGFSVLGSVEDIPSFCEKMISEGTPCHEAIIAIPSAEQKDIAKILNALRKAGIKTRIIPGMFEIIKGDVKAYQIRDIAPSDLLGREEIGFDEEEIISFYKDKVVFVTGGAGSIGSEIVKELLKLPVKKVFALDYNENSIHEIYLSCKNDPRFFYIISNVRDTKKIEYIIQRDRPDIIFHAAAHKHVHLMEHFPEEAVKNNVLAAKELLDIIVKNKVKHFLFVSTDKAVRPTSVMGATKRIVERIIMSYSEMYKDTSFKITRFGNVLGSSGSVIPIFEKQIKQGGPVTVTHPDMVRYFMSIPEATRLVIKSASLDYGNIFVLDMGKPVKILDLAKNMILLYGYDEDEIQIKFTGIREGEKLYEELLMDDESLLPSPYKKLFIAKDKYGILGKKEIEKMAHKLYQSSENNSDRENIFALIKEYVPEYIKN